MAWILEFWRFDGVLLVCGVLAGLLSAVAFVPYMADTLAGRTVPQRASWLIWSVLSMIALISQIDEGASASLWFAAVQATATTIIFALSTRRGSGTYLSRQDLMVLAIAAAGLVVWWMTDRAAYALAISVTVSLIGGLPTAAKAYYDHESETLSTWVLSLVASCLALASVGSFDIVLLAYPLYLFTLYSAFVVAMLLGRSADSQGAARADGWSHPDSTRWHDILANEPSTASSGRPRLTRHP